MSSPKARAARRTPPIRRAVVGVGVIAALVILQVCVVAGVTTGARQHETAALRVDAARSFYAAEAAMNLAVREIRSSTDFDSNGTIGGVATRTLTSGASLSATATGSGPITLTARGSLRGTSRSIQATAQ